MHDRRIDGRTVVFGNQGWLYMRAMTWWDHDTHSIWSQPVGEALIGPRRGTKLRPLPAALVPWGSWRAEHPETLLLDEERAFGFGSREPPRDDFVIGIALGDAARAYRYPDLAAARVLNDAVGPHPVLVYADPATRRVQTFLRALGSRVLTFAPADGALVDAETGSRWDPRSGLATAGPLRGELLRVLPHNSSFDWAWRDFYPQSSFYRPP